MKEKNSSLAKYLKDVMRRRKLLPSQFAAKLGVSPASVSRWLAGLDTPKITSCCKLAEYCKVPVEEILSKAGYLPGITKRSPEEWPEFREYARYKYPTELDEDFIVIIEDLIERRRNQNHLTKRK